jgi:hypothetical protein
MQKARRHPSTTLRHELDCRLQIDECRLKNQPVFHSAIINLQSKIQASGGTSSKRAPTACRHVVSGSLSSPCRGSSHLSLALLGSLSVAREYLALRDGPRGFRLTSTCRVLLRYRFVRFHLSPTGLSPALVELSRSLRLGYSLSKHRPYNPIRTCPYGLGSSAFARRY